MAVTDLQNSVIADALEELADLYELDGAIVHRVLAYRSAARSVREAPSSVAALARAGRATELPRIGPTIQEKVRALQETGAIPAAVRLRERYPAGLRAVMRLRGIGAKRARLLHSELRIDSPQALREAALAQRVRSVRGLGPKFEQAVLAALQEGEQELPSIEAADDEAEALAAAAGLTLIAEQDIRGDLHCHTTASDGHASIEEMATAAIARGYRYLAITDHSASHGFGNDVSPEELRRQIERVRELNASIEGIELLAGSEVNVLPDGSLDYQDDLLAQLDWVVASVHTSFGISREAMTKRMVAAIEHPLVDAIGHPTGRLIERRAPYALDLQAVFEAAAANGTLLEINGNPDRRDLSAENARAAATAGVRLVIDSDAHRVRTLANMRWGVATARRALLTKDDVANTLEWPELRASRKRTRTR